MERKPRSFRAPFNLVLDFLFDVNPFSGGRAATRVMACHTTASAGGSQFHERLRMMARWLDGTKYPDTVRSTCTCLFVGSQFPTFLKSEDLGRR